MFFAIEHQGQGKPSAEHGIQISREVECAGNGFEEEHSSTCGSQGNQFRAGEWNKIIRIQKLTGENDFSACQSSSMVKQEGLLSKPQEE